MSGPGPGEFEAWAAYRAWGVQRQPAARLVTCGRRGCRNQFTVPLSGPGSNRMYCGEPGCGPARRIRARKRRLRGGHQFPPVTVSYAETIRKVRAEARYVTLARNATMNGPVCQAWIRGSLCGLCQHDSCWAAA